MQTYGLTAERGQALQAAVEDLAIEAAAEIVILLDRGGNILAENAVRGKTGFSNIAALGAGVFVATRELATLVGERAFSSVYHQGEHNSVYMCDAVNAFIVVVIFDQKTTIGLVRLFTAKMIDKYAALLESVAACDTTAMPQTHFELNTEDEPFATVSAQG